MSVVFNDYVRKSVRAMARAYVRLEQKTTTMCRFCVNGLPGQEFDMFGGRDSMCVCIPLSSDMVGMAAYKAPLVEQLAIVQGHLAHPSHRPKQPPLKCLSLQQLQQLQPLTQQRTQQIPMPHNKEHRSWSNTLYFKYLFIDAILFLIPLCTQWT